MKVAIHQPEYFPCLALLQKISQADVLVLLDDVQFKRDSLQQRAWVCNTSGAGRWLTIPFVHKHPQLINEVQVADREWPARHRGVLQQLYGSSPCFEQVMQEVERVLQADTPLVAAIAALSMQVLMTIFGIDRRVVYSSRIPTSDDRNERLVELCRAVEADTYVTGRGGATYLDDRAFQDHGITIELTRSTCCPRFVDRPERVSGLDAAMHGLHGGQTTQEGL